MEQWEDNEDQFQRLRLIFQPMPLVLDYQQLFSQKIEVTSPKGSLTVWTLYAYFSGIQNAAFWTSGVMHVVSVQ